MALKTRIFVKERLLKIREDNGITQVKAAKEIGISSTHYSRIESGYFKNLHNTTVDKLNKFCEKYENKQEITTDILDSIDENSLRTKNMILNQIINDMLTEYSITINRLIKLCIN